MALKLADYKTTVHNDWCPGCGDFGIVNKRITNGFS
jgi:2-oxoglutarate ferredoxin oxidoreductase subunit beta